MYNSNYRYCPRCGQRVLKTDRFCPHCRYPLSDYAKSPSKPQFQDWGSLKYYNQMQGQQALRRPGTKYRIKNQPCSFSQAFISFWHHYFDFSGYCSRSEFWWWFLFEYTVDIVWYLLYRAMSPGVPSIFSVMIHPSLAAKFISGLPNYFLFMLISFIWGIVIFLPDLALRFRRLRDAGLSEEWRVALLAVDYFPAVVPVLGYVVMFIARIITIIIACQPSVRYQSTRHTQSVKTPPL